MSRKLSLAHLCELDTGPQALLREAGAAGFTSLCLRHLPAAPGGVYYPLAHAAERDALVACIASSGAQVCMLELVNIDEHTRAEDFRTMCETAVALGCARIMAAGNSPDLAVVALRLGELCDLAGEHGLAVDIEFMPFRGVRSLADALEVIERAGRSNAHIMVDALHFVRSHSELQTLRTMDPALIGGFQICDGPLRAPADLVHEARCERMLPGLGEFPLYDLLAALPAQMPVAVEVPLYLMRPELSLAERLRLAASATTRFLEGFEQQ